MKIFSSNRILMFLITMGFAHQSYCQVFEAESGNVVYSGVVGNETQYIEQAYAHLCNEFVAKYYSKKKLPNIYLHAEFVENNKETIKLEYDNLHGNSLQKGNQGKYSKPGIRITVNTEDSHSDIILKLLDYAINNLNAIKKIRNEAIKLDYYDQPEDLSLSKGIIDSIISRPSNERVSNILNLKVYRGLQNTSNELEQFYYLQNDTFHFYTGDYVYLKLQSIYQIINVYEIGHLIFNTNSTLYYYNPRKQELSGKLDVNGEGTYFLVDYDNYLKRVLFETHVPLQGKAGFKKEKYLLLADENKLINNYDELEDEIIKTYLKRE